MTAIELAYKYAKINRIEPELVVAIMQHESGFNEKAYNPEPTTPTQPSYGLMQIKATTASQFGFTGDPAKLYDPETNIQYGTKYIAWLASKFTRIKDIISGYNAGSGNIKEGKPYVNPDYVNTVYRNYSILSSINDINKLAVLLLPIGILSIFGIKGLFNE